MGRKQITGYVSESTHRSLTAKAQASDLSVSEFVGTAVEEKLEREGIESRADRYQIEERVLRLVDDAADRAAERIVEQVRADLLDAEDGTDGTSGEFSDWGEDR